VSLSFQLWLFFAFENLSSLLICFQIKRNEEKRTVTSSGVWWQAWAGGGRGFLWVLHLHFGDIVLQWYCTFVFPPSILSSAECEWREPVETRLWPKGDPSPGQLHCWPPSLVFGSLVKLALDYDIALFIFAEVGGNSASRSTFLLRPLWRECTLQKMLRMVKCWWAEEYFEHRILFKDFSSKPKQQLKSALLPANLTHVA
jgi:hypothetical protein